MTPRIPLGGACLLAVVAGTTAFGQTNGTPSSPYYDLGGFHRPVSTESPSAQRWFDRGLAMCYGFNHEEAVRCFELALDDDPGLAMALWGLAYAWGPNINNMEVPPHQMAQAEIALRLARRHARQRGTKLERALIDALAARYAVPAPEDRAPLNRAYAKAMRGLHDTYTDDRLVVALYAESLMNLQPWKHWSPDGRPAAETAEIVRVLEGGLAKWPDDPALCHLYIHTMEASPTPAKALPAANRLRNAMPGVGHLVHMPSHIDVLVGDYPNVIEANRRAIVADTEFALRAGRNNFYTYYRIHNYHFLVYGAMFDGQSELALKTARQLVTQIPTEMLREQVDFLDAFVPTALHVLVRFGRWDEILKEPEPAAELPVTRSIWHYARALAFAATGRIKEARAEQQAFVQQRARVPETSFLFQNASQDILGVAEAMIAGEVAYREGNFERAFQQLREAVRRDDSLNYDEPWGWMQPARHALAALLVEQGRFQEAERVYRADLRRHPHNPWSLHGLSECLAQLGNTEEAETFRAQFVAATQRSDVNIDRSCYCRLRVATDDGRQ